MYELQSLPCWGLKWRRGVSSAPGRFKPSSTEESMIGRWGNQAHWMGEIQGQTIFTQLLVRL